MTEEKCVGVGKSARVLVVDDYERFRRFVRSILQKSFDFRNVLEASDGAAAVELAEELKPDLVLLDIGLPTLNGILMGALGVLAFIFSAVSPYDDDFQQEFGLANKQIECVLLNWKSIPSIRGTLVNPVQCALVPRRLSSPCCPAIGRACISAAKIQATGSSSRTSDGRSPPTITS